MNLISQTSTLDRHDQRREAGLPTISVVCGPLAAAMHEAGRWAERTGRPLLTLDDPGYEPALEAWVDRVSAGRDLARDAIGWLARQLPGNDLAARWGRITPLELAAFLDAVPAVAAADADAAAACRWLLEQSIRGESIVGPGLSARLGEEAFAEAEATESRERVVLALRALVPRADAPVLLLTRDRGQPVPEPKAWLAAATQSLARLALGQPAIATILVVEPGELDEYLQSAPESRAKALIRAGLIGIPGPRESPCPNPSAAEIAQRLDRDVPNASLRLGGSIRRLAGDRASESLVASFIDAAASAADASASSSLADVAETDRARSAAERFLFECLESLPATAGRFELNGRLDFRFGPTRSMEVDLLARDLKLAVEVDGYYHFLDAEGYRRDRRKDLELQRQGYLVVRVLAEDVVAQLEVILSTILDAVAFCRACNPRQRGDAS